MHGQAGVRDRSDHEPSVRLQLIYIVAVTSALHTNGTVPNVTERRSGAGT